MKRNILLSWLFLAAVCAHAQQSDPETASAKDTAWKTEYRASYPRINDLVHTRLAVRFDYDKQWMYGEEWVTLQPHFYETDSLTLDAKGMDIQEIALVSGASKMPLKYDYDSLQLRIRLNKSYKGGEKYTLYIKYISRPNELKVQGSAAISDAKGLYFINPKGETDKHIEIWTQGETESNSVWFPTIDKPDQKTTQEIAMTVPAKYVSLSNGTLVRQQKNADGTRTDYWKMDLPNSPYLFFMGVGDYTIVKDRYKNIPVDYYVEKEYAPVAKKIFGETPAMMGFFEKITGVPYVWSKYAQIVGRDYVSGAMENTTATLHQDGAYQNARQLVDENVWESTIAHELFHHWFGDLVTTESWSNLTLNESFANYSEYLWDEYRHGKDAADEHAYEDMQGYLMSGSDDKSLVRFYYRDKEDMFDAVSYNKGGRILNMLRNYVGDSAFFKSLNKYLTANKFKPAEAHQLRLAFEDVTGRDLNWFWNQWYYGSGQPDLNISYDYSNGRARVIVNQVQESGKIFKAPVKIDVYNAESNKKRYAVWLQNASDTFYFASAQKPSFINVDADKVLLCNKTDNKTAEEFEQQYKYAPNYLDRREALEYFAKNKLSSLALGLNDKFYGLRLLTLNHLISNQGYNIPSVISIIEQIAAKDPSKKVQGKALEILAHLKDRKYEPLFEKYLNDSSYSLSGAALEGFTLLHPNQAYGLAKKYAGDAKGYLGTVVMQVISKNGSEDDYDFIAQRFSEFPLSENKIDQALTFAQYLSRIKDGGKVRKGVDEIMKFRNMIPEQYRGFVDPVFKQVFSKISSAQETNGNKEVADYIKGLLK